MWDMDLSVFKNALSAILVALCGVVGCTSQPPLEAPRTLQIQQTWELKPGDELAGHRIIGGLGDISIALSGDKTLYAPLDGRLQPHSPDCVIFSSEELPIYLFRLCGVQNPHWGQIRSREKLGTANILNLAVLNRRADGKWAFVEPSKQIIEQMLQPPNTAFINTP